MRQSQKPNHAPEIPRRGRVLGGVFKERVFDFKNSECLFFYFQLLGLMSLSKHLQTSILPVLKNKSPDELKSLILQLGRQWYSEHSEEQLLIENNLNQLGITVSAELISNIKENILLHYYEKLLPLSGGPQEYFQFLNDHVDNSDALEQIESVHRSGRGILLATAHFGAVELIAPFLATRKLPMNVLLRFTTEQMSASAHDLAEKYFRSGLFGQTRFIELGKPKTSAALDMAAVLRRNELLLAVFDERTDYSIPVTLYNKQLWGGAGLHKLIAFTQRNIALFTIFMLRQKNGRYKLIVNEIDKESKDAVQMLYNSLSDLLADNLEQWYFLHEELPFVETAK